MSYSRSYRRSVHYSGSVSGSVSYPASQSGGSCSVTLRYNGSVPVDVYINVDTNPFDSSVSNCKGTVNLLTGSVIATKTAQINQIKTGAKEISNAIINGFFKTAKSEISQQIALMENEANSTLLHLQETIKKVLALKEQMQKDYERISERYVKIFEDLNAELINRIYQIDNKVFEFEKIADKNFSRILGTNSGNTVAIFGKENAFISTQISAGSAKSKAFSAIKKARDFLFLRKRIDNIIKNTTINENKEKSFYSPACFIKTNDETFFVLTERLKDNQTSANCAVEKFKDDELEWQTITDKEREQISVHLNAQINETYNSAEPRSKRIREMAQKLANLQGVQVCRN